MIGFGFSFCLLFKWSVLDKVLLVVGWCQVLYSRGFLCMSSHYLILPRVSSPEKAMAPHSSTLAWKIPWTGEPGRLQSMGSLAVGHDWATSLSLFTFHFHTVEKEMATHSSVLAWRIPGTWEPGGRPSMGSHRVGHDWSDLAAATAGYFWLIYPQTSNFLQDVIIMYMGTIIYLNST